MLQLPNGCKCSDLSVWPKNWKTVKASTMQDWYITYRFYDPSVVDVNGKIKPKLVMVKGMNHYKKPWERKAATEVVIQDELQRLLHGGYNPIKKAFIPEVGAFDDILPTTPFVQALREAFEKGGYVGRTLTDIRSMLNYLEPAAIALQFQFIPVREIKKKHIRALLAKCAEIKPQMDVTTISKSGVKKVLRKAKWTDNTFNTYTKYLSILFNRLVDDYEACGANPVKSIKKKKIAKPVKRVLTPEECEMVDRFAYQYDRRLWMLIHVFFHSGSRTTELFNVQGKHVNLQRQEVLYLVKKGQSPEWIVRPIKDIALLFWQMAMEGCGAEDYVFSKGLRPGPNAIRADQITKRWNRHIKKKLKIESNWYSLKHLNTTQTINWIEQQKIGVGEEIAAGQNGHKGTAMVVKIYDVDQESRQNERIRKVANTFG